MVELARLLRDSGAISRVHSACTPNIRQIFDWTAALSFSDLSGVCLPEQVDGVECDVSVLLPTMTSLPYPDRCAELDLEADGIESTRDGPRERCTLPRLETFDGSRAGWYYDTESPTARDLCASRAWLALRAVSSVLGVRVEVRCEVPVPPGGPPVPEECVL